eukprot:2109400-Pyramimonas_sp.AAC.1
MRHPDAANREALGRFNRINDQPACKKPLAKRDNGASARHDSDEQYDAWNDDRSAEPDARNR